MQKLNTNIPLEMVQEKFKKGLTGYLDIHVTKFTEYSICGTMPVSDNHKQPYGLLHGGANAAFAESLGSFGSFLIIDPEKYYPVGLEVSAQHLRSVTEGHVHAVAKPIHTGRSIHVWDITITDDEGKLVCKSKMTNMIKTRD